MDGQADEGTKRGGEVGMSIQVNDFQWEPGKNDAEYIKLLKSSRDEWQKIAQKAITKQKTLSRAQEPHVMTLEELVRDNVVYLEDFDKESTVPGIYCDSHNEERVFATKRNGYLFVKDDDYGVRWRCWTAKPTEGQRKAVKWDG